MSSGLAHRVAAPGSSPASSYARQFLDRVDKPQVDAIEEIPPAIAIDQTNPVRTSRSTVGTMALVRARGESPVPA